MLAVGVWSRLAWLSPVVFVQVGGCLGRFSWKGCGGWRMRIHPARGGWGGAWVGEPGRGGKGEWITRGSHCVVRWAAWCGRQGV